MNPIKSFLITYNRIMAHSPREQEDGDRHHGGSELARRLRLLATIQPGYTLNVHKRTLVYRRGVYAKITRYSYNEDREKTIRFIEETVECAIGCITSEVSIFPQLKDAKNGIANLRETYIDDPAILTRIDKCLTRIENSCTRFQRLLITSIEQIPQVIEMMQSDVDANEYLGVKLVRQTPINRTPSDITPISQTPNRSPSQTPPPTSEPQPSTPPSTPTKIISPQESPINTPPSSPARDTQLDWRPPLGLLESYRLPPGALRPPNRKFAGVDMSYLFPSFKPWMEAKKCHTEDVD